MPVAVSVPGTAEVEITMTAENWAFGTVNGTPRAAQLSARPAGTEAPPADR